MAKKRMTIIKIVDFQVSKIIKHITSSNYNRREEDVLYEGNNIRGCIQTFPD
jgi:hypothetical protein